MSTYGVQFTITREIISGQEANLPLLESLLRRRVADIFYQMSLPQLLSFVKVAVDDPANPNLEAELDADYGIVAGLDFRGDLRIMASVTLPDITVELGNGETIGAEYLSALPPLFTVKDKGRDGKPYLKVNNFWLKGAYFKLSNGNTVFRPSPEI